MNQPFFVLMIAALACLPACSRTSPDEDASVSEVPLVSAPVGSVARQSITRALALSGTIGVAPNQGALVNAAEPGRVVALAVAPGDLVQRGQVIAEIDSRALDEQNHQAAAALQQARTALADARASLARAEDLFAKGLIPRNDVEKARTQAAERQAIAEQAAAAADAATRGVQRAKVTSPIDGQVVQVMVTVGQQVEASEQQPLMEVANLAAVELAADIPAADLVGVRVGLLASVSSASVPDRTFDGRVVTVAPPVAGARAGSARVLVRNADGLLRIGMPAQGRIVTDERRDTLVVPATAVVRELGQAFLYVVNGTDAERRQVRLGIETQDGVEVLEGAAAGERILTSNVQGLGAKARLRR